MMFKEILHPTDSSPQSEAAFHLACALARDHGARLVLMHVWSPVTVVANEMGAVVETADDEERLRQQLQALTDPTLDIKHVLQAGDPVNEIVNAARELDCDLIVMSTHGRRGLSRLLMGSVAEKVVRRAPCPVLTVKEPQPEAARAEEGILQESI
ncbi:MAG: universal stress protein [Gemmataceae bacterium]